MQREAHVARAVGDDDRVADAVVQPLRHVGAEHGFAFVREGASGRERERPGSAEAEVLEVGTRGADHPIAAMRIAQRDRNAPRDLGPLRERAPGLRPDVVGGVADAEHGREQQVHRAAARAHDEVRARHGRRETLARFRAQSLHAEQQQHGQRDGQHGEPRGELAVAQALPGEGEDHAASLISASSIVRSNRGAMDAS